MCLDTLLLLKKKKSCFCFFFFLTCLTSQGRQSCQDWEERGGHRKKREVPRKREASEKVRWRRAGRGLQWRLLKAGAALWQIFVFALCPCWGKVCKLSRICKPSPVREHCRRGDSWWFSCCPPLQTVGTLHCMMISKRGDGVALLITWHIIMLLWCLETWTQVLHGDDKCNLDSLVLMWISLAYIYIARAWRS